MNGGSNGLAESGCKKGKEDRDAQQGERDPVAVSDAGLSLFFFVFLLMSGVFDLPLDLPLVFVLFIPLPLASSCLNH